MIGYLYHITSKTTGKMYIGITSDIVRRFRRHKTELNNNTHHSPKLQNAWNYYGADDFIFSYEEVEINQYDDLYEIECAEIAKYDSYNNGYNSCPGGKIADWRQKVQNQDLVDFLCIQYYYGDGYGKTFEEIKGWSKGTASACKRGIRFLDAHCIFEKMSEQEKITRAQQVFEELQLSKRAFSRQMKQGGCEKSYQLTQDDFFFAFCAQEMHYGYSCVALYLGIKSATVKDWFNGRSRKKEKNAYLELSLDRKQQYQQMVKEAHLEELENTKERISRRSYGSV